MEKLLPRCLDSVVEQNYADLEIILVNDGSRDLSGDICDSYARNDSRIRVIHKTNAGVSAARNSGLNLAKGDYVSFIDPDDWIDPDTYSRLAKMLTGFSPDIIRFNAYRGSEVMNKLPFEGLYEGETLESEILLPMVGADKLGGLFMQGVLWVNLFKMNVIETNDIRFNTSLRRNEDRLFVITYILHSQKMLFVPDVFYHYEMTEGSLSNAYKGGRWEQEAIYMDELTKIVEPLSDKYDVQSRLNNDCLLRAIQSIHHEFFTDNNNTFCYRRRKVAQMLKNSSVRKSLKNVRKNRIGAKENLILFLMKWRCSLFLSIFETLILRIRR